jgi:NAD(P)H-hydrate epimerase
MNFREVGPPSLPPGRKERSHKGDYGHVLVVGGSRRMMGAALMCSQAAIRVGAGLTTLACPRSLQPMVPWDLPTSMSLPLPETPEGSIALGAWPQIQAFTERATVLAVGPGLSRNRATALLVQRIVREAPLPVVLDADGLNALEGRADLLNDAKSPIIVTPHPGEMSRLNDRPVSDIQQDRRGAACRFAARHHVTAVLKGAGTVVAGDRRVYVNPSGNPYMACGGAGDVLTGMVAGLLAQKLRPFDAARTAVYWHGLAADRAPNSAGPGAVTATDIVQHLNRSASDIDWYNEEIDLDESHRYDPDRTDEDDEPNPW